MKHVTDWDADLRALLEEAGIDPDRNAPVNGKARLRRRIRQHRGSILAMAALAPTSVILVCSGAPAAAVTPLLLWLLGWIAHRIWRTSGSPAGWQIATATGERAKQIFVGVIRLLGRYVWYPIATPIRVRVRARRIQKNA
ncbi:hypothetical protein AB0H49_34030 [Nocardia sp. NPDC050713]|uniref:hypothetical protein n=1 Tax=Nocardia sp. NPDC050713 TaxID=3154511 RepID=UPI0033CFF9F1